MTQIQFFEGIFEEKFCLFLLANARARLEDSTEFTRSNFHWTPTIRKSSAVVLVRNYDDVLSRLILDGLITAGIVDHSNYSVMNYAWTRFSYIPWHNDGSHSEAITIYLNEKWDADWGGLFLYKDEEDGIRGFAPSFNCGLKNLTNVLHCTTPVSLEAPEPRFTVQIFPKKPEVKKS